MSVLEALKAFALLGVPFGIALGAGLGLVAHHEDGWGGYGSFRRRAARLGHVAAVMLPLLAGFYALAISNWAADSAWAARGAGLWMAGSVVLVGVLFASAWRPRISLLLPLPALTVLAGGACLAVSMLAPGEV